MVHQYKNNGFNIVLDVNSGAVHVVDDIVYDLIPEVEALRVDGVARKEKAAIAAELVKKITKYKSEEIEEAVEEIEELAEAGMLFT